MIIKVCGMRDADNIREANTLDIDMTGFIFCKGSPRYVRMISSRNGLLPDYSEERLKAAVERKEDPQRNPPPGRPLRVGVFADEMPQTIITRIYNHKLDYIQLHGDESREMIENLRRTVIPDIAPGIRIIKTLHIATAEDVERHKAYEGVADMLLFDTRCETGGGSGKRFDWSLLRAYHGTTPFLLSGGIGPEDAARVKAFDHPMCAGIDINSRFETEPGIKDIEALRRFVAIMRQQPGQTQTADHVS